MLLTGGQYEVKHYLLPPADIVKIQKLRHRLSTLGPADNWFTGHLPSAESMKRIETVEGCRIAFVVGAW